ncbi:hypothetical protein FRB90_005308 [Tulasnella sp. 427]|nr:hypothetical protein FRB90_005308 [Tulasnella sp. 427]
MMDPTTGQQPVQYANAQQWTHYMQGPYLDQAYNGPPPSAGAAGEFVRTINRAGSSTSLTPSSESSLAGWNNMESASSSSLAGWNKTHSADDIPNFGQHSTDMQQQSRIAGQREEWGQWGPMTADPAMMQQPPSNNSGFNPSLAGQHAAAAGGLPDNFYQEGLAFNNGQTGQSPKQFGQVSPTSGMQSQPSVWNPQHPPSMGPSSQ